MINFDILYFTMGKQSEWRVRFGFTTCHQCRPANEAGTPGFLSNQSLNTNGGKEITEDLHIVQSTIL
jgi:hypothetical protein